MQHQIDAVNKLLPTRIGGLFMDMGTGKTRTITELIYQRQNKIDKVIYFCPVSLKETVRQELLKHTTLTERNIYLFDHKTNERNIPQTFIYIAGIESMSSSTRVITTVNNLVTENSYVSVDESSYIKGHRSLRTERITKIAERARYRNIMTGTPLSQGVVDLFAQMRFLSPKILGYNSFYSFAANHLEYSEKFPGMIVRSHNLEYIAAKIKPYIYQVTKEECLTLPPKLYETRYCSMTDEQRFWYNKIKDEIFSEMDTDDWNSVAIFRLFTALQEIVSGFLNWKGKHYEFENNRPETLLGAVQSIPENEKIIIFCKFQYDIDTIKKTLSDKYGQDSIVVFDGRDNEKKRNKIVDQFRKEAQYMAVTQSTGGHGFNWQDISAYTVFYNNGFKYSERQQAEDRIHRPGQTRKTTYTDIYCVNSIDKRIDAAMTKKGNAVYQFRKEIEKVKKDRLKYFIENL
jgi:SNF2 family DNA or RNA helicase